MAETQTYVVVVDAVTVDTGRRTVQGTPIVERLELGATIQAPEDHPSVQTLVSMKGIVREDDLDADMAALRKQGGVRRPTVIRTAPKSEGGLLRVTAAGVSQVMTEGEPPTIQTGVEPIEPTGDPVLPPDMVSAVVGEGVH